MSLANYKLLIRNLRTGNIPKHSIFHLIRDFNMTKQDLIERLTETMKIRYDRAVSKTDVASLLDALGDVATDILKAGDDVPLPGLGKLVVKSKAARIARNPKTGEAVQVPAKRVPDFTPAKALKDAIA